MADDAERFELHFEGVSSAEAAVAAENLRNSLLEASDNNVRVEVRKPDATTMDFGATLLLILGTPAILSVAKGIAKSLGRERAGTLVIKRGGEVVFKGNSSDAAKIAEVLRPKE